jgi:GNAT superfamily N-acetyltransferase
MNKNFPSSELVIRPALFNDIVFIQEIVFKTWPETYIPIIGKEQVDYMIDMMYSSLTLEDQMKKQHYFFIALREYQPVGFASVSMVGEDIFKLQKIYVLPVEQKTGTGRALLEKVETVAKSMGAARLQLNVNRKNGARLFYEKKGFAVIKEEDIDIGHGYFMNDYVMEKEL